ncbi:MAG: winged helix-turn-helix transcriptional regulator [Chloroflexi bacterium]|nr:winged helix-turn-helix transcriptional regulator [Chloroflexota bacterium]
MLRPTNGLAMEARLFRALGDEPRLVVLQELESCEQRVSDLADRLAIAQSSVSTHLATLHAAGAVARRAAGRSVYYGFAHPSVGTLLGSAHEVVLASLQDAVACTQPCCVEVPSALAGEG